MITQFYSASTPEEAVALMEGGCDHIGISPITAMKLTSELRNSELRAIVDAVGPRAKCTALMIDNTEEDMLKIIGEVRPAIIHLCGDEVHVTPEFAAAVRARFPGTELMQAIPVVGPEAVDEALYYGEFCEFLILDSVTADMPGTGAAGVTHDWNISREICARVSCKVILAGGLGPDNVEEAIRAVRPHGVDSLTKTNAVLPDGRRVKDLAKCRAFCDIAHAVGKELGL